MQNFIFKTTLLLGSMTCVVGAGAAEKNKPENPPQSTESKPFSREEYEHLNKPAFWVHSRHEKAHNSFWPVVGSFLLPGLDQWIERQAGYAAVYSGTALLGTGIIHFAKREPTKFGDLTSRDPEIRKYLVGSSLYSLAGGVSAYQSFQTAVTTQRERYYWLDPKLAETPQDLALAPLKFSYLTRHTTYIPLGIGLLLMGLSHQYDENWTGAHWGDAEMAGVLSYSAGVNEEALFRGFLMPTLRTAIPNDWGSNLATATIFSAAHISSDLKIPWPQFIFGYYLGYLSQANNWTLGESIFIHTWWDVMAFLSGYATTQKATFILSPLQLTF